MHRALPGIRLTAVSGTVGARIAATGLGGIAAIAAARGLGPHGRALLALMMSVPTLCTVVGVLGLDNANARFAGRSHTAFRQVVRRSVVFAGAAGSALGAAWWCAGVPWPVVRLGLDPRLAVLSAALCPVSLLVTLLGTAEVGRDRIAAYNLVMTVTTAAYMTGIASLFVTDSLTVAGSFLVFAASQVIALISYLVLANGRVHPDGEQVSRREYGSYAFRAYFPNLVQYGMLRMDIPIIAVLAGTTAVAMYAVALPVAEILLLIPTAAALVIFPRVTAGAVDRAAAGRIGRTVLGLTAAFAAVTAAAAPVLIPAVYGARYRDSVAVVWYMLPGLICYSAVRIRQAYLAATDHLEPVIKATAAAVVVCLAGLVALASHFGAAGAGAADSAGYLAFAVVLVGVTRQRDLPSRWAAALRSQARRAALACRAAVAQARPVLLGGGILIAGLAAARVSTMSAAAAATAGGAVLLLAISAIPELGLYLLAVVLPLSQSDFAASLISPKALALLIVACLIGPMVGRRLMHPAGQAVMLGIAVAFYLVVSMAVVGGSGVTESTRTVLTVSAPLLFLPLIAGATAATRRAVLLFCVTMALLAIPEALKSESSITALGNVTAGISAQVAAGQTGAVNHNAEGALFVIALAVSLAFSARARRGAARLAVTALILAEAAGVAYSFSRASYFGAITVIAAFALRRSFRGLAGLAMACGCLLPLLPAVVVARFTSATAVNGLDISSDVRLDLWGSALRMFDAHPVIGVGYQNFAAQLPAYFYADGNYNAALLQFRDLSYAHNTVLSILAETGLVGALLAGMLITIGWRRAWFATRSGCWAGESALLALVGIGVCSLFGEPLFDPAVLAVLMLTVLAAPGPRELLRAGLRTTFAGGPGA